MVFYPNILVCALFTFPYSSPRSAWFLPKILVLMRRLATQASTSVGWRGDEPLESDVRATRPCNTKGYSSTDLAMGFANVRAGTWYPPEH